MQPSFKRTGGARIGWVSASWPLAQLCATQDKLTVKASLLGTYTFTPQQVSAVERYVMIPVLAWGVRVRHTVPEYPQQIVFSSLGSPDGVLGGIRDAGFVPVGSSSGIPVHRGIPARWSAIFAAIIVWNVLFMLPFAGRGSADSAPNWLVLVPLIAAFGFSIGTLRSPRLQHLILKPGRNVGEIRHFLSLLACVTGLLLVVFAILVASGAFNQPPGNGANGQH